jgi:hypothetical protein
VPYNDVMQHIAATLAGETSEGQDQRAAVASVQRRVRQHRLGELLDELEAEHGTVPESIREQTRRMWPSYEEGR